MAIEAVIWDFGGVFTTSPFEAFNRYEAARGLPKDLIRTVNATNPLENAWALFERAEIDRDGLRYEVPGGVDRARPSGARRRRAAAALGRRAAADGRGAEAVQGSTSRSAASPTTWRRATGPACPPPPRAPRASAGIMAMFDVIVIESSKTGVRKPDPRIYQMACELMGVAPAACVYLDDLGDQLQAGRPARHEGDQGGDRGAGAGRPRRRHRPDLPAGVRLGRA